MSDMRIDTNPNQRGQTYSSWLDETNLHSVVLRLIKEHPNATSEEIKDLYIAKIEMVPDLVEQSHTCSFNFHWLQIHKPGRPRLFTGRSRSRSAASEDKAAAADAAIQAAAVKAATDTATQAALDVVMEELKTIARMELEMPNGKKFGDCTRADFHAMGGQFVIVGDRIGDDVSSAREKLTERDIDEIIPVGK